MGRRRRWMLLPLLLSTVLTLCGCLAARQGEAADHEQAMAIQVVIADGFVQPNGQRFELGKGQTVRLSVRSDIDDEVHIHTAGDGIEVNVRAGEPTTRTFVVNDTGSFEVESHHLEKIIAILVVR